MCPSILAREDKGMVTITHAQARRLSELGILVYGRFVDPWRDYSHYTFAEVWNFLPKTIKTDEELYSLRLITPIDNSGNIGKEEITYMTFDNYRTLARVLCSDNYAAAAGSMLIWLIEQKVVTIESINKIENINSAEIPVVMR